MTYVKYRLKGRPNEEYYKAVNAGLNKFIESTDVLYKNIPKDECRNYKHHLEASYLCHGIWTKIMQNKSNNGHPYSSNWFLWKKEDGEQGLVFHFDIMNNPKEKSCGLANKCSEQTRNEWKEIYHSIGNMTPVPWFEVDGKHYINGQLLHKALDERWDLYLKFLKDNWDFLMRTNNCMTFEEYVNLTCQQMYFKKVYNNIDKNNIDEISIKDINDWKITPESELIDFSESDGDAADKIVNLIKIRCKVISVMLVNSNF